ncbi:hypothetical protein IC229_22775 [Spirosoma sp. BT702]|uniref:Uncharacterized protein n=1 Tax=Spirosoma profusum TaxID=2771354 RepID=A0A926Y2Y0_9BACT|nr:hypothetical protein [Spirosoma profusum]MBD2703487.1 hypothetical protein [Spirosoma profusum]
MKYILWIFLFILPLLTQGQDEYYQTKPNPSKRTYRIELKDGTQLRGELLKQDSTEAIIRTDNLGEVKLKPEQIIRIEQLDAQARPAFPNLFPHTLRLTPTAFQAEKGRVYFHNYCIYISQFEYGITDNWSVGTSFFSFLPTNLFSLNTKVSVPVSSRVRVGVNAQYVALRTDITEPQGLGYLQGMVTTGDQRNNTTFGLGWSIADGEISRNIVGTFGLVRKVSPRLTLISENFVLFGAGPVDFAGILSMGLRFDRQRHAFDIAAYIPFIAEPGVPFVVTLLPYASYHIRIGK